MTDSYLITFSDGRQDFLNNAACFAPLKNYKERIAFRKKEELLSNDNKPVSLTYYISSPEGGSLIQYCMIINKIKYFKSIILNISVQNNCCVVTVDLTKKIDAVLYTLGAFRLFQEYPEDTKTFQLLLLSPLTKYPEVFYLLCENLLLFPREDEGLIRLYDRGHSNQQHNLLHGEVMKFFKGEGEFGVQRPFSKSFTYEQGWGELAGKVSKNYGGDLDNANFFYNLREYVNDNYKGASKEKTVACICAFVEKYMNEPLENTVHVPGKKVVKKKVEPKKVLEFGRGIIQAALRERPLGVEVVHPPVQVRQRRVVLGINPADLMPAPGWAVNFGIKPKAGNNWPQLLEDKGADLQDRNLYQKGADWRGIR